MSIRKASMPNARETLLLKAALLPGGGALDAWKAWKALGGVVDETYGREITLFPLVSHNLQRFEIDPEDAGRLRGTYRRTWYRNRIALALVASGAKALIDAGIEPMLLKGAALVSGYGADVGSWHMNDADILVRPEDTRRAADALLAAGWAPPKNPELLHRHLRFKAAQSFYHPSRVNIDLHWAPFWHERGGAADTALWQGSRAAELNAVPVRVPAAAEMLVHLGFNGLRWFSPTTGRWPADLVQVIRHEGEALDWDAVVAEARRRSVAELLAPALAFVANELEAPVPASALSALRQPYRPRLTARLANRADHWQSRPARRWAELGIAYLADGQGRSPLRQAADLPTYVAYAWKLPSARAIPLDVTRKLRNGIRRLRRGAFTPAKPKAAPRRL